MSNHMFKRMKYTKLTASIIFALSVISPTIQAQQASMSSPNQWVDLGDGTASILSPAAQNINFIPGWLNLTTVCIDSDIRSIALNYTERGLSFPTDGTTVVNGKTIPFFRVRLLIDNQSSSWQFYHADQPFVYANVSSELIQQLHVAKYIVISYSSVSYEFHPQPKDSTLSAKIIASCQ